VTNKLYIETAIEECLYDFGGIDILIANAGLNIRMQPEEFPEEVINEIIDVNLKGAMFCAQMIYPELKNAAEEKLFLLGHSVVSKVLVLLLSTQQQREEWFNLGRV